MAGTVWRRFVNRALPVGWVAVFAAPLATHAALATGRFAAWATLLAIVEVLLLGTLALRRVRGWRRSAGAASLASLVLLLAVRLARPHWAGMVGLIAASGVSHAFIYGSLLLLFGRSLQPGRIDIVTGIATKVRSSLTPEMLTYTRTVTKAWCVFFALQLVTSAVLLVAAPHRVWSLFVNVLDGPSVVALFAVEYGVRRWRFRNYSHISPMETFRTFSRSRAAKS